MSSTKLSDEKAAKQLHDGLTSILSGVADQQDKMTLDSLGKAFKLIKAKFPTQGHDMSNPYNPGSPKAIAWDEGASSTDGKNEYTRISFALYDAFKEGFRSNPYPPIPGVSGMIAITPEDRVESEIKYNYSGFWFPIAGPNANKVCSHDYINVGFNHVKMVCKHCNEEQ